VVIDADYCGNVCVVLFNHSATPLHINRGVRVAQLISKKIIYPDICEVQEMEATERGTWGIWFYCGVTKCILQ
jgi:dUTPase